jgi:hypothetical protein
MTDEGPIKALLGVFPVADAVTIPAEVLARASDEIDRERSRRAEAAAVAAQAAAEAARKRGGWLQRLRAWMGRGR